MYYTVIITTRAELKEEPTGLRPPSYMKHFGNRKANFEKNKFCPLFFRDVDSAHPSLPPPKKMSASAPCVTLSQLNSRKGIKIDLLPPKLQDLDKYSMFHTP